VHTRLEKCLASLIHPDKKAERNSLRRDVAHEPARLSTKQEEEVVEKRCQHLTRARYSARNDFLREMGKDIQANRMASVNTADRHLVSYPPIRKGWTTRILLRHPSLGSVVSQQLDLARWKVPTREALSTRFRVYLRPWKNQYNMDKLVLQLVRKSLQRLCGLVLFLYITSPFISPTPRFDLMIAAEESTHLCPTYKAIVCSHS
jgi:hypothetical protein